MLRLWFNRTYATNAQVIDLLRANPDGHDVHVIGTHTDPDSPVLLASDHAEAEPDLEPGEYVEWALGFAAQHGVDVFVPRLHMAELADARDRFLAVGTRLLCPEGDTVRLFADKPRAYAAAASLGLPVPPHRVVSDAAGLRQAHAQLAALGGPVCMKPTHGTAGAGYRVLVDRPAALADFAGRTRARAGLTDVCAALEAAAAAGDRCPKLLLTPYLDGPEISMDVLADADGAVRAVIGRTHAARGRRRHLVDDPQARVVAETLTTAHRVSYLSNTQVRYWRGQGDLAPRPYLLEVNTRISGGLFQTALAGVNLPWAAVRLALGEEPEPIGPRYGAAFTTTTALVALNHVAARGTRQPARPLD